MRTDASHNHPGVSSLQQAGFVAAVYYALLAQRIPRLFAFVSSGFTMVLLLFSLFGFYQLGVIVKNSFFAPAPTVSAAEATLSAAFTSAPANNAAAKAGLPRSAPTALSIPAIGLQTGIVGVGQNEDGSMAVPPTDVAGWYTLAPTPGEIGPAVLVGHVDSPLGQAVFYNLKKLKKGDELQVARQDGRSITFKVDKIASYDALNFPTQEVYGNINHAGIRLITCDGDFDYLTGKYSNNLVVYATAKP